MIQSGINRELVSFILPAVLQPVDQEYDAGNGKNCFDQKSESIEKLHLNPRSNVYKGVLR